MKRTSIFAKITVYYLMLSIFFALSSVCFVMLIPTPVKAIEATTSVHSVDGCTETVMPEASPILLDSHSAPTNVMPCCVEQDSHDSPTATLQQIELIKQTTSGIIVPVQNFITLSNYTSYNAYYYSPPPDKIRLDTIVIRV